jgi:hypothetical protein
MKECLKLGYDRRSERAFVIAQSYPKLTQNLGIVWLPMIL